MRSPVTPRTTADPGRRVPDIDRTCLGFRLLVPGWSQMALGQRPRGLAHGVSFLSSLAVAGFGWGTWLGWTALGMAVLWQLASMIDVLRQRAFPVFHPRIATLAAASTMALVFYLPALGLAWLCAWPSESDRACGTGYLVNRLAYRGQVPRAGQWIWYRGAPSRMPSTGRVVAVEGQEIVCTGRGWRVDGREIELPFPGPATDFPDGWSFVVPTDHVVVGPESRGAKSEIPAPLIIVGRDQIVGRAWARYYPLWDRCLL